MSKIMQVDSTPATEVKFPAWYAAYVKHQHEKSAADLLERKGLEVFLPLYRAVRRWKDRTQIVPLPIFPGYVFVRTELDRKLDIVRTPGIFWLVENGGRATAVPDSEIETIRRITRSPAAFAPHPFLKSGDRVRVRVGPLFGIEGILVRAKNGHRLVLSVDLLQQAIIVEVDSSAVEPLSAPRQSAPPLPTRSRRSA